MIIKIHIFKFFNIVNLIYKIMINILAGSLVELQPTTPSFQTNADQSANTNIPGTAVKQSTTIIETAKSKSI